MHSVTFRMEAFTAEDLPTLEQPNPVLATKPAPAAQPVRSVKVVNPLTPAVYKDITEDGTVRLG